MNRPGYAVLMAVLAGLILVLLHFVRDRLKQKHADLFVKLGKPTLQDSSLGPTYWTLEKFIWWDHFSEVDDKALHALCLLACLCELSFGLAFFL